MGAFDTTTAKPIESPGIYQSSCACRTAVNLYAGDTAPHCLSCGDRVTWRMVQAVHQRGSADPRRVESETRLVVPSSETRIRAPESETRLRSHLSPDVARVTPHLAFDSVATK